MGALVFAPARVLQVQPIAVWKDALLKRLTKPLNLEPQWVLRVDGFCAGSARPMACAGCAARRKSFKLSTRTWLPKDSRCCMSKPLLRSGPDKACRYLTTRCPGRCAGRQNRTWQIDSGLWNYLQAVSLPVSTGCTPKLALTFASRWR